MKTITASEFKAKCLALVDEVARTGEEIVVTKRGKPVSKLVPLVSRPASLVGLHKGLWRIRGDLVEPVDEDWDPD